MYVDETFSGAATGTSRGLGVAPQLSLGVLVAVSERIDLFARGFGQVSGGSISPGFNSIWCAGLSLGGQLRFPAKTSSCADGDGITLNAPFNTV